ncbi:HEAT repeat domain-containing protein [Thermodesulfovibrio thiophilus]|uniref:HEAT repeat domain-containing protein n=1 Tax=Thermodesulfovibrio thiophilus TaxID=340095 RepID=UPI00146C0C47|nr:HEAT repeat domain-containing protein [Thermodesulfovibrio thiophilus]HHW20261.1 HEAT repeat domain-containing protein [Thermodesulfovibrio thiophilus]HOA82970.1 HEAT repeat domain-containing protein [Thermodesulfovibrio thiophilus]
MKGNGDNWRGQAFEEMLFDYLDNGYLENIITFFEHDPEQIYLIPKMIKDERIRIKVGAIAIIEEIKEKNPEVLKKIVPSLIDLLESSEKNIRGDAAYALEIIADPDSRDALLEALNKEQDTQVREFIEDALKSIT